MRKFARPVDDVLIFFIQNIKLQYIDEFSDFSMNDQWQLRNKKAEKK